MSPPTANLNNSSGGDRLAYAVIAAVSAIVLVFLVWLIYWKEAPAEHAHWASWLPALNCLLNGTTTFLLILGFKAIKEKKVQTHTRFMLAATVTSGLFLVSYILYHHFQGDTKFLATGFVRPVYFFILISHIILSIPLVPMVFLTLYHAAKDNREKHRRIARKTFPVWIYVSITGVLIYVFLKLFNVSHAL